MKVQQMALDKRDEYEEAVRKAQTAQKYGSQIDPESMTRKELIDWARQDL